MKIIRLIISFALIGYLINACTGYSSERQVSVPDSLLGYMNDFVYHGNRIYSIATNDLTLKEAAETDVYAILERGDTLIVATHNSQAINTPFFHRLTKTQLFQLFKDYNIDIEPEYALIIHGRDSICYTHNTPYWELNAATISEHDGIEIEPFVIGNRVKSIFNALNIEKYCNNKYRFIYIFNNGYRLLPIEYQLPVIKENIYISEKFDLIKLEIANGRIKKVDITDFEETAKRHFDEQSLNSSYQSLSDWNDKANIELIVVTNENVDEGFRILIKNDTCQSVILRGTIVDDENGNFFVDKTESTFPLSQQQTDSLTLLLSNIENINHFGKISDFYDCQDAYLSINGKQIYYTSEFQLPTNQTVSYSDDRNIDKLIRYLIKLSKIKITINDN